MKTLKLLGFTILILGMLVGSSAVAQTFSVGGPYAFVDNGFVTMMDPTTGQMQPIPTASVGRIVVDEKGKNTVKAVMNIGGFAILKFESTSLSITVDNKTGLGTAEAAVKLTEDDSENPEAPLGSLPPGLDFSDPSAIFHFNFVVDADGALNIIGTKLLASDNTTAIVATVSRGVAKPQ